jgi:hypothetical protein
VLTHPLLFSELIRGRLDDLRRDGAQAPVETRELRPTRRRLRLRAGLSLTSLRPRRLRTDPRG